MDVTAPWDTIVSRNERDLYDAAGFGGPIIPGAKPAILVIDVTRSFCGDSPMPIDESIKVWRKSCGGGAWDAIASIRQLIDCGHLTCIPVIYTRGRDPGTSDALRGRWREKSVGARREPPDANHIVDAIAPTTDDLVLVKDKPSAFFGTSLVSYLIDLGIDTLIVCGGTTSGCVRATVIDAFSYNFRTFVVADSTFDRGETSHLVSLFDMHMKYANVTSLTQIMGYLEDLRKSTSNL